jgi:hypothetical protein
LLSTCREVEFFTLSNDPTTANRWDLFQMRLERRKALLAGEAAPKMTGQDLTLM